MPPQKPKQTLTGLIRSRLAEYQARQWSGETQKMFAEELTAQGHPISYADFRKLYSRARKQLKAITLPPSPTIESAPVSTPTISHKSDDTAAHTTTKSVGYVHRDTGTFKEDELI